MLFHKGFIQQKMLKLILKGKFSQIRLMVYLLEVRGVGSKSISGSGGIMRKGRETHTRIACLEVQSEAWLKQRGDGIGENWGRRRSRKSTL